MAVPVTEEQKKSPLYKYYEMDIAPVPADLAAWIMTSPVNETDGLEFKDAHKLMDPGYLPGNADFGVYKMPDGGFSIANTTPMIGVTSEMFAWWFAWHGLDSFRYTIWDKDDHWYCQTLDPQLNLDASKPMAERFYGQKHEIKETLMDGQPEPDRIVTLHFLHPTELGIDGEKYEKFDGVIACTLGAMVHCFRNTPYGGELRTRFWFGYEYADGEYRRGMGPGPGSMPEEIQIGMCRAMLMHNVKEYRHMAKILPQLYAEFKDDFLVGVEDKYK
ncbi:MAG: hypothetical protein HUJ75_06200 [Parasporobacterium sp.]|nr:hypothetical protein [Parasporobacterium sp.]